MSTLQLDDNIKGQVGGLNQTFEEFKKEQQVEQAQEIELVITYGETSRKLQAQEISNNHLNKKKSGWWDCEFIVKDSKGDVIDFVRLIDNYIPADCQIQKVPVSLSLFLWGTFPYNIEIALKKGWMWKDSGAYGDRLQKISFLTRLHLDGQKHLETKKYTVIRQ